MEMCNILVNLEGKEQYLTAYQGRLMFVPSSLCIKGVDSPSDIKCSA